MRDEIDRLVDELRGDVKRDDFDARDGDLEIPEGEVVELDGPLHVGHLRLFGTLITNGFHSYVRDALHQGPKGRIVKSREDL